MIRTAGDAVGARGGEPRPLARLDQQRLHEALAQIVGQLHLGGVHDIAVRIGEADIAGGADARGGAVIDDALGLQGAAAIIDLHVADGRDGVAVMVVDDLGGAHEHARIRVRRPARVAGHDVLRRRLRARRRGRGEQCG
jgi:hypothetical protein